MSERDELADIFTGHEVSFGAFPKRLMRGHAQEIADKILAAGYRKQHQQAAAIEMSFAIHAKSDITAEQIAAAAVRKTLWEA